MRPAAPSGQGLEFGYSRHPTRSAPTPVTGAEPQGGDVSGTDDEDFVAYVTGRIPVLRRVATQLAGDAHRGDDLVQQAITRLYTHWRRASRTEHLDAYVYKILLRAFLDERRLRWAAVRL